MSIDPYNEVVRRCFHHPDHAGELGGRHAEHYSAQVSESAHGAQLTIALGLAAGRIAEMRFRVRACPHLVAALEICCSDLEGQPISALGDFDPQEIMRRLSVPAEKIGKILLLEDALASLAGQTASGAQEQH